MKATGIVLLSLGLLSLFGGIIHPSGAIVEVVIIGYVFKFALVFGGIALISSSDNKQKKKDSLLITKNESFIIEKQNSSDVQNTSDIIRDCDKLIIPSINQETSPLVYNTPQN